MSMMEESLKHAAQKREESDTQSVVPGLEDFISETSYLEMDEDMISLYRSTNALLTDSQHKVIQFIGSREGEGTSTIVREFAMVAAAKFDKSVLLLDADIEKPGQHNFFRIYPDYSCEDIMRDDIPMEDAFNTIGSSSLFVSIISRHSPSSLQVFDFLNNGSFREKLNQFDLILIDSPPATTSSDGLAISRLADGVVFVVEAEKTRWPVAESIKEKIIQNGGKILGIAFNKRRHHIPGAVYRRL